MFKHSSNELYDSNFFQNFPDQSFFILPIFWSTNHKIGHRLWKINKQSRLLHSSFLSKKWWKISRIFLNQHCFKVKILFLFEISFQLMTTHGLPLLNSIMLIAPLAVWDFLFLFKRILLTVNRLKNYQSISIKNPIPHYLSKTNTHKVNFLTFFFSSTDDNSWTSTTELHHVDSTLGCLRIFFSFPKEFY